MKNINSSGSEWHKWDLHIHSTASDGKGTPQEIVKKAKEIGLSVIALTDHHSAKNIDEIKKEGAKENITIISGIEFRTEYGRSSVHMIGLFPEKYNGTKLDSKSLQDLILTPLGLAEITIIAKGKEEDKSLTDDKAFKVGIFKLQVDFKQAANLIHQYGGLVSVHAGSKTNSIDLEMRNEGSSKKNVSIYDSLGPVKEDLFRNGYIDICEIRHEKDSKDFYYTHFKKPSIQASDAHCVNDIGSKYTWIKADTTFEGLKQILNEPIDRVCFEEEPTLFEYTKSNSTKFIDSVKIEPVGGYLGQFGKWFDNQIPLNKELVAIIGNKGNGKSAIADIIALCCDFQDQNYFSFLRKGKFRDGKLAKNFTATVTFASNISKTKNLDDSNIKNTKALVKYLPQGYFEGICNDTDKIEQFREEIESVVFQYIDDVQKLGKSTFKDLIKEKTDAVSASITELKSRVESINKEIISLEKKENIKYANGIQSQIDQKQEELKALKEPDKIENPNNNEQIKKESEDVLNKIGQIKKEIQELEDSITDKTNQLKTLHIDRQELNTFKDAVLNQIEQINNFKDTHKKDILKYNFDIDKIINVNLDLSKVELLIETKNRTIQEFNQELDEKNTSSIKFKQNLKKEELKIESAKLGEHQRKYQKYISDVEIWKKQKAAIEGTENEPNTINGLKREKEYLEKELSDDLKRKKLDRIDIVKLIFNKKQEIISVYRAVKTQIDNKIDENRDLLEDFSILIEASLSLSKNFPIEIFNYIAQNVKGSFKGKEDGAIVLNKIMEENDINNFDGVTNLLNSIINKLKFDEKCNETRYIDDQVTEMLNFYNYLFSLDYLEYYYQLKQGEKNLETLSPGEKGALLLVFYLLLDMDNKPLILDQPEDNLDNDSVANILVNFIKRAKKKRQIIMVTHNPNLAVVADAEQIIYTHIDKKNKNTVTFESGSIENPSINKRIVDVLEGAMPAFRKRDDKYYDENQ